MSTGGDAEVIAGADGVLVSVAVGVAVSAGSGVSVVVGVAVAVSGEPSLGMPGVEVAIIDQLLLPSGIRA
jgi:hypothetical protein